MRLDERGKACPQPVIDTKKKVLELEAGTPVEVAVDNEPAVQNLRKLAEQSGWSFKRLECDEANTYLVEITRPEGEAAAECRVFDDIVVLIATDRFGQGSDELGAILTKGVIYAMTEVAVKPTKLILMNGGAKLSVEGSKSLEDLRMLESQGVQIITCGTCLQHYGLTDKLGVGEISNMYTIAETLLTASKVVRL